MKAINMMLAAAALCAGCQVDRTAEAKSSTATAPVGSDTRPGAVAPRETTVSVGGVASCQPTGEMSAMVSRWMELADSDGNGQISRKEAQSFTNFLIGGFFFKADSNGDSVISPEEGRSARSDFIGQYPALATLLNQARSMAGESPFKALAAMLDLEYGKPLSADDARAAAKGALDDLFAVADSDSNGTITPAEARAASWAGARNLGQQVFRSVDANGNGKLDLAEFQSAVDKTSKLAFEAGDANDNGTLTEQEAGVALGSVIRHLGIPTPDRSSIGASTPTRKN